MIVILRVSFKKPVPGRQPSPCAEVWYYRLRPLCRGPTCWLGTARVGQKHQASFLQRLYHPGVMHIVKNRRKTWKSCFPSPYARGRALRPRSRFARRHITQKCAEHMLGVQNLAQVHAKRLARFLLCSGRVMIVILRVLFKNRAMDVSVDVSADAWTGPVCPGSPRQAPSEGE